MPSKTNIAWIVPYPSEGSGGYKTIVANVRALDNAGFVNVLYIMPDGAVSLDADRVRATIRAFYGYTINEVYFVGQCTPRENIVIATAWNTAHYAASLSATRKIYFIQDFEPCFYPVGDEYFEALSTYQLGLKPITIGKWLAHRIESIVHQPVPHCDFCVDLSTYHPTGTPRERAVCINLQPEKPRRLTGMLIDAIRLICQSDPSIKIYTFGSNSAKAELAGMPVDDLGLLAVEELNDLFNQCLCGICLSSSNPSRQPFEMAAAGLAVIDLDLENNHYDLPAGIALLASPTPAGIASAVVRILNDPAYTAHALAIGPKTMASRPASLEAEQFVNAVNMYIGECVPEKTASVASQEIRRCEANPEMVLLDRENRVEALSRKAMALTPVVADSLIINVAGSLPKGTRAISIAAWRNGDQSDIVWSEVPTQYLLPLECKIELPATSKTDTVLCHVHCYALKSDGEPQFLVGFAQVFVSDGESRPWSKTLSGASIEVAFKATSIHSSQASPNVRTSFAKRFFRRRQG